MVNWSGPKTLVVARLTSFAVLVALCLLYGMTLVFFYLASGTSRVGTYIWLSMVVSILVYFRWPWAAVTVSWIEMIRALLSSKPWEINSPGGLIYQLGLDLLLLAAAHVGLVSSLRLRRHRTGG